MIDQKAIDKVRDQFTNLLVSIDIKLKNIIITYSVVLIISLGLFIYYSDYVNNATFMASSIVLVFIAIIGYKIMILRKEAIRLFKLYPDTPKDLDEFNISVMTDEVNANIHPLITLIHLLVDALVASIVILLVQTIMFIVL